MSYEIIYETKVGMGVGYGGGERLILWVKAYSSHLFPEPKLKAKNMAPWCSISEMDPSDPEMCAGSVECLAKSYDRQQFSEGGNSSRVTL